MTGGEIRIDPGSWDIWVASPAGPQLIVAGPGTGKTEFLVGRVAHIVNAGLARRDEVSFLTFSRRSAADIKRRVTEAIGGSGAPIDSSTFHSLALRLLESASGVRPVPLTPPEQVRVVAGLLASEDPGAWPVAYRGILTTRVFAGEIADFLTRCSERLLSPDELAERAASRADWKGIPGLFSRYRRALEELARTDYGTLLVSAVELLRTPAGFELADGFRYVVVDEYQDTTPAQAEMARLLAAPHGNLTVAGDPYQSIYSFRGAELRNIAAFTDEHPQATRIILDGSMRVPREILESALRVVSSGELPGSAGPVRPAAHRGRVEAYTFDQETSEADWIAREVEQMISVEGVGPASIAVLVRSKRELLRELARALDRRGIAHDQPDSRLVDHPAVRVFHDLAIVAGLGSGSRPTTPGEMADVDRAVRRILLGPLFSVGLGKERDLLRVRRRTRASWPDVIGAGLPDEASLAGLIGDPSWTDSVPAVDGLWEAWSRLDAFERLVADPARSEWRSAITSFAQVLGRQADRDRTVTLLGFFEMADEEGYEVDPLIPHRPDAQQVALTTLHQSKGLEFDAVFIANAVEGVFPDLRRSRRMLRPELLSPERISDGTAQHLFQVQEEMRLAYTAMTRARLRVVWTATNAGADQGEHRPSRFLVAAAGAASISEIGPPVEVDRPPVTVMEAEVAMRRAALDPTRPSPERLAATRVLASPPGDWWEPSAFAGVPAPGPDRPILGAKVTLSPSQADMYSTCPRRYALERRLRLGDADSPHAQFGTLVHSALERAEKEVVGSGQAHAELDAVLEHLETVWSQDADFGTPELDAAWLRHARALATRLYASWPSPEGVPIDLEMKIEATIDDVPWTGVIDRLERTPDGLKVVDYKTSKRPPSFADAAGSIQLAFYATAVARSTGEPVIAAEMWFPRAESKSVTTRSLDMSSLVTLEEEMARVTSAIKEEKWEPTIGEGCKYCSFRLSCPAWPEGKGAYLP